MDVVGLCGDQNRFNAHWWPQLENHSVKVQMAGSTRCSECGPNRDQKACVGIKEAGRAMVLGNIATPDRAVHADDVNTVRVKDGMQSK